MVVCVSDVLLKWSCISNLYFSLFFSFLCMFFPVPFLSLVFLPFLMYGFIIFLHPDKFEARFFFFLSKSFSFSRTKLKWMEYLITAVCHIKDTIHLCVCTQSCLTLCDTMDCSVLGFSVRGIPQARKLEWVAIPSSRGSSQPGNQTCVSCIAGGYGWATGEASVS